MNGAPLPYITSASDVTARLTSGLLVISPKGGWSLATDGAVTIGSGTPSIATEIITGTWHSEGNTVTLLASNPPTVITATHSSGTITYTDNGASYRFVKQ